MNVLHVIVLDTVHAEAKVGVYMDREAAIASARREAKAKCDLFEHYLEEDIDGTEFYAVYDDDGSCVRVISVELSDKERFWWR